MTNIPAHEIASFVGPFAELHRRLETGNGRRFSADLWPWDALSSPEEDDALLRHLLADDALGRFLVQASLDSPFDPIACAFMQLRGQSSAPSHLVPDHFSTGVLIPSLVCRRNDKPIVVRGATMREMTPHKMLLPETALDALFKHASVASVSVASPTPISSVDDTTIDLSVALTAARGETRVVDRPDVRRRRPLPKRALWAAAAMVAAITVIAPLGIRRAPPASSIALAATSAPEKQPAPALPARVAVPIEKLAAPLLRAKPPAATVVRAASDELPKAVPTQARQRLPVAVAEADEHHIVLEGSRIHTAQIDDNKPRPVVPVARDASHAAIVVSAIVPPAALPSRTAASRVARRKPKKPIAGRETTVASALELPDVLKPH